MQFYNFCLFVLFDITDPTSIYRYCIFFSGFLLTFIEFSGVAVFLTLWILLIGIVMLLGTWSPLLLMISSIFLAEGSLQLFCPNLQITHRFLFVTLSSHLVSLTFLNISLSYFLYKILWQF